jgi:hypothetical protein
MKLKIKNSLLFLLIVLLTISCEKDDELEMLKAPVNLMGSTDFALKVELNWDIVAGAISYQIYRKDALANESVEFELIGESDVNNYIDLDVESDSEYQYFVKAYNGIDGDSSGIGFASTIFITTEEAFDVLAEYTGGIAYETPSASQLSSVILTIINNHVRESSDLVFLIDNTGSMADDIVNIQLNLTDIINALPPSVRVGVAEYGDNNIDVEWFDYISLSSSYDNAINYINTITPTSGGDTPESVYDGIHETIQVMNWLSESQRIVIVIGDAPPLEGDLTNHTLSEVIDFANSEGVLANLYPILVY